MSRKIIGQANHVYSENDVTTLKICTIIPDEDGQKRDNSFVTIGDSFDNESIIINSIEQWEQVNAFVRKAFDDLKG